MNIAVPTRSVLSVPLKVRSVSWVYDIDSSSVVNTKVNLGITTPGPIAGSVTISSFLYLSLTSPVAET